MKIPQMSPDLIQHRSNIIFELNFTIINIILSAGGSCFLFIQPLTSWKSNLKLTSWSDSYHACTKQGGQLPLLHTLSKFDAVTKLFDRRSIDHVHVGLQSGNSLPTM